MREKRIVLPDTSLCAIVRDEVINPAGGIVDFVESTVPFVERAVIVDTGSIDGTRKILTELEERYPQLSVSDRQFDDFASSRNYALSLVETGYVLVLDADERLFEEDFIKLREVMKEDHFAYRFRFIVVLVEGGQKQTNVHNPRLFQMDPRINYRNKGGTKRENLFYGDVYLDKMSIVVDSGVTIKHFHVDLYTKILKDTDWYEDVVKKGLPTAPSEVPSSAQWKAFNPRRLEYH